MASTITFLDAVNRVLKRTSVIQGDSGDLSSFVESSKQVDIDVCIQVWNEITQQAYSLEAFSAGIGEGSITLVTATTSATDCIAPREYALATDFEAFTGSNENVRILRNQDETNILHEYPGGFEQMKADQALATITTSRPLRYTINPIRNCIEIDSNPAAEDSGDEYKYLYDRRISLTATSDLFPYSDTALEAFVPAVAQLWKRDRQQSFDGGIFTTSFNRGLKLMTQGQNRTRHGIRRG